MSLELAYKELNTFIALHKHEKINEVIYPFRQHLNSLAKRCSVSPEYLFIAWMDNETGNKVIENA